MKNAGRILTTHAGSLPRSPELLQMLQAYHRGEDVDRGRFREQAQADLNSTIASQCDAGVDIVGDGELPRIGFQLYVKDRMTGFGGVAERGAFSDFKKFPKYAALRQRAHMVDERSTKRSGGSTYLMPEAQGRVEYDPELHAATEELDLFETALAAAGHTGETFVTAASPGIISTTMLRNTNNAAYATDRDYVFALAEEMRKEYECILSRGHILQLDAPDLAMERTLMFQDRPLSDFLARVEMHVDALNTAIAGLPPERIRLHVCWGNWDGPHVDDVDAADVLPIIYRANVGAICLPFGNPRHQHEHKVLRRFPPPPSMQLVAGVIDSTTNMVEHPEVVADRICTIADAVGSPGRVVAGTDCGMSTYAGWTTIAEDVVWAKLRTLAEGAQLASERLR